jgi:C-terminal processing protease CtpA/Prc
VISTFEPNVDPEEFANTVTGFLQAAQDDGVEKIIIDVSGNGGGLIELGYFVFQQVGFHNTPFVFSKFGWS